MSQTLEKIFATFVEQLKAQAKRRGYSVSERLGSPGVVRLQGEFDVRGAFDAAWRAGVETAEPLCERLRAAIDAGEGPSKRDVEAAIDLVDALTKNEEGLRLALEDTNLALVAAPGAALEGAASALEGMARAERQRKLEIASVDDFMAAKGRAEGFEQAAQAVRKHKPKARGPNVQGAKAS